MVSRIPDNALLDLVPLILQLPDGFDVAADCVYMRIIQKKRDHEPLSSENIAAGKIVIDACEFERRGSREVHAVEEIIEACLIAPETSSTVEMVLERLRKARANYSLGFIEENRILGALMEAQPLTVLNNVFAPGRPDAQIGMRGLFDHGYLEASPLDRVAETILLGWCDEESTVRYPLIASKLIPFAKEPQTGTPVWKKSALTLLERAPDKVEVLRHYTQHFQPMSWSGSRSATWDENVKLLQQFEHHPDSKLVSFAASQRSELQGMLSNLKAEELNSERNDNERFE